MIRQQQITPKIITKTGYMKLGATGDEPGTRKPECYKPPACYKEPDRNKKFDWTPIKRGTARLVKVIKIILTSSKGNMTAERAYEIVLSRKRNLLPVNIYGRHMGAARFKHHYHKTRAEMGIADGRAYKTSFIKENKDKFSIGEIAIYLETTEIYVKQTISKINRGIIK